MEKKNPTLTLNERDRRWRRTREMMDKEDLSGLIVFGLKGREKYEGYLTNESIEGLVIFPANGDPTYLTWGAHRVMRRLEDTLAEEKFWVSDIRVGVNGPAVVEILMEKRLDQEKIGVVGLASMGPAEMEGIVPYKLWSHVVENLPKARFEDVSMAFAKVMIIKSEEELELVRHSAEIGEIASENMMKITKPGVYENEIYAKIMHTIYSHVAISPEPHLILASGPSNITWGPPIWGYRGGKPYQIKKGDVVQAEIFPCYGGMESQQQMCIALEPVNGIKKELAKVARQAYEEGVKTLRPGKTFQQVCEAMQVPLTEAGCWNLTPLIHSLTPLVWVSHIYKGIEQMPGIESLKNIREFPPWGGELEIQPGMVFEFEPNACREKHRINIGGTVIVTENGPEELNKLATEMRVLK